MGCVGSKEPDPQINDSKHGGTREYNPALDGPPDFGVNEAYEVVKLLGEGGSGQTWLCYDLKAGRAKVAIKFIPRPIPKVVLPMLFHEIRIQAELGEGHVNLVKAQAVLLTPGFLGIVMEYAPGGNLTQYVTDKWESADERNGLFLDEDEALYIFKQYLGAVEYLHAHHVAHRDLKLDNIVLDNSRPPCIKVCDFGFAKNWDTESNMFTQIGTPVYMCPQLISSKNTKVGYDAIKADMWACGVLLFVMLLGMFPFEHSEHPDPNSSDAHVEVWLQQIKCSWRENPRVAEYTKKLSPECISILDRMFDLDEKRRIDVGGVKEHPWFNRSLPPRLQTPLSELERRQAEINAQAAGGPPPNKPKRDEALNAMLEQAGREFVAGQDNPLWRIDLTRFQRSYTILGEIHSIVEESHSMVMRDMTPRAQAAFDAALNGAFNNSSVSDANHKGSSRLGPNGASNGSHAATGPEDVSFSVGQAVGEGVDLGGHDEAGCSRVGGAAAAAGGAAAPQCGAPPAACAGGSTAGGGGGSGPAAACSASLHPSDALGGAGAAPGVR